MSTTAPSPRRIEAAMSAAMELRSALLQEDGTLADDDRILVDTLDGETDVFSVLDRIVENSMADAVLAELADARAKRLKARKDRLRNVALAMLEALEVTRPLERAAYTASIQRRTKAIIVDATLIPPSLLRTAPDLHAVAKALKDGPVSGAEQSNPMPHIVIRTR
jgi:hypothetical protein